LQNKGLTKALIYAIIITMENEIIIEDTGEAKKPSIIGYLIAAVIIGGIFLIIPTVKILFVFIVIGLGFWKLAELLRAFFTREKKDETDEDDEEDTEGYYSEGEDNDEYE
jgi:ABC-type antimicrobial peptide transport system permease subunit